MTKFQKVTLTLLSLALFTGLLMISVIPYGGRAVGPYQVYAQNGPTGGFQPTAAPVGVYTVAPPQQGNFLQACAVSTTAAAGASGVVQAPCAQYYTHCGVAINTAPGGAGGDWECVPTSVATVTTVPGSTAQATYTVSGFAGTSATTTALATPNVTLFGIN
jgi:hypothetical protein